MKRIIGTIVLLGACGVGDETTPGDDTDERILCEATLRMSGTFTAATTLDPLMGCQPLGTWNVNVALEDMGNCTGTIPFKPMYQYTVTRVNPDPNAPNMTGDITYNGTGDETRLQISAGGSGQCDGAFTHLSPNGTQYNEFVLRPWTPDPTAGGTTLAIMGDGTYTLWKEKP